MNHGEEIIAIRPMVMVASRPIRSEIMLDKAPKQNIQPLNVSTAEA